uniref:Uncharacterized protein n=1 Tax=Cyprinus carpio TaxID=7962 RepID=A0A8C2PUS4_CYPCA
HLSDPRTYSRSELEQPCPPRYDATALFDKGKQTICTLLWVKCCICILMGCYRVINALVRMYYPRSELKGSLPNRPHSRNRYFSRRLPLTCCSSLPLSLSHRGRL